MNPSLAISPRGPVYAIEDNGVSATTFIPDEITKGETQQAAEILSKGVAAVHERLVQNTATFKDDAQPLENARAVETTFKSTFKSALNESQKAAREFAEADARSSEPAALTNSAWETAFIGRIEALPLPERIRAVADLSFVQSSALTRYGDLDRLGLPADIVADVRERHAINGHLARTGLAADYARRPDLKSPLSTGIDHNAAFAAATAVFERHKQRGERIQLLADTLRSTVSYVATATGKTPETVWAELTA